LKANHNGCCIADKGVCIERTKTKIKFESKSQLVYCCRYLWYIERTKTKIKFESKSQLSILDIDNNEIERTKTKIKFESKSQLFSSYSAKHLH